MTDEKIIEYVLGDWQYERKADKRKFIRNPEAYADLMAARLNRGFAFLKVESKRAEYKEQIFRLIQSGKLKLGL